MTGRLRLDRLRRSATAILGVLLLTGLTACLGGPPPEPARPNPVALRTDLTGGPLKIGVVVSLTAPAGEGAEWRDAAEGAQVAVRRFAMGGTVVILEVLNDQGSVKGATDAVKTLVARQVAGIVMATSGTHLTSALGEAARAGTPVLLPYADSTTKLPPGVWLTGPTRQSVDARLVAGLRASGTRRPFLVDAGGAPIKGLATAGTAVFRAGGDSAALAAALARRQQQPNQAIDAVVVSGPAALQAAVVRALQGARLDVPYVLTTQAMSPAFPVALHQAGGSLATPFVSAGVNDSDAAALESSSSGRALAAYFSALRLTAADAQALDLLKDRPFSAVAGAADVRSHDAVVALVRTAASVDSGDPRSIGPALANQTVDLSDGLAGTALNFSSPTAVAGDTVVVLESTADSPGVRPVIKGEAMKLFWFPKPAP